MIVGVPKESFPGEQRVAMVPSAAASLTEAGLEVLVEAGAGDAAGFRDGDFQQKGARIAAARDDVFAADVLLQVRAAGANPEAGPQDEHRLREGQLIIAFAEPYEASDDLRRLADRGVTLLAMELIPRITRAQSMDALSSMATISGYKAVLLAAERLPKIFPMLMTAAGMLAPARVLIVGAGVAGLQAIATARRLGGVVSAYDIRPAVKEQVESVGAKFIEMDLDTGEAEGAGGYARQMDEEFYRRQRELMQRIVAEQDVVITTAAVPGKPAPRLITAEMVGGMAPGAVIVDLAAERGGNCELTRPGETVVQHGVTIAGPLNLPSSVPNHASQMYAKNTVTLLRHLLHEGQLKLDTDDEIVRETMVTHQGQIVHPRLVETAQPVPKTAADAEGGNA